MALTGISEVQRLEAEASTLQKMEELGHRLRELIATQPIYDLLGYIYWLKLKPNILVVQEESGDIEREESVGNTTDDTQILLEYIHSTLASTP